MKKRRKALVVGLVLACFSAASGTTQRLAGVRISGNGCAGKTQSLTLPLDSVDGLEVHSIREDGIDPVKTKADVATYRGRRSLRIVNEDGLTGTGISAGAQAIAIVTASEFKEGTLQVDVAALPREGAPPTTRGFVGIAFHVQDLHGFQYESFYLRMTNARSRDQLERNHATQYVSEPEFRWQRLRRDNPGVYESYVDLELGAWTRIKIVVAGTKAQMFIDGADQPCLIVNDLKLGEAHGQVALWTGSNTQAYFSNLTVK